MPKPPRYVSRSDLGWGKSPAAGANPRSGLVIHYDSIDQGLAGKAHSACITYWKATREFHTGPSRGWADIGYSFLCCSHGHVIEGRGLRKVQAAQPGGNSTYYSATLATGPRDEITEAQIDAVRALRQWLMEPDTSIAGTVKGHRDFISTSCPGDKAYALVRNGTFKQPPGSGGGSEDDMVGLRKGDSGERVKYLQVVLADAGFSPGEVDGDYGASTAAAVLAARKSRGSKETSGDKITGWAAAQIMAAHAVKLGG
ncbi:putative peptidoglycan binding protein [Murinocardiopsis flavida]|uniref:Putative peptidoglycan binding protein n=1 Tax=Murinocardiopsis flavida TaxID=645275 RepID=A0A2P8D122_9ACTN|nr:peptidoglycan recognition family protein [Murinocardiopsis flavida]PSK90920.1 putative peptidoglycan binding protein [Murinocardiopsis flavida]